ncbi:UNKNOWN [Stylonychia lemnae]|uniref:ODAD1 central coiled coil region domain-containing protein n=1 Tax=Stylonychia lemnae TaxID=5949 RepID=A0A078AR18_STYLE|nr:UNKNOWN [Stylonychia lemnae]|eukprot:CDW83323.1 UNKNOWN [Stylonychia lemnae]
MQKKERSIKEDQTADKKNINNPSEPQASTDLDGNMGSRVAILQKYGDNYAQRIKQEQIKINEINNKIKDVQIRIEQSRKMIKDSHGQRESTEDMSRKIKSIENRLDKQLQKFNQAVAHNKMLRAEIDSVRKEKVVFDNIYKKLDSELAQKKEKLLKVIKRAENAFSQKEQALNDIQLLKKEQQRDQEEYDRECEKLNLLIQKDKQIRDYIKTKEESKAAQQQANNTLKNQSMMGDSKHDIKTQRHDNLNELTNTEKSLKKQVSQLGWSIARDTANVHLSMAKMQQYEEAFNSIKLGTNLNNIDQLVSEFVNAENLNFSLYNFVKDLTHEMDDLENEIMGIRQEIEKFRGHGVNNEKNRDNIESTLNNELKSTEKELKDIETDYQNTMKTINCLKIGIQSIFDKIKIQPDDVPELIGSKCVTESNMLQYLGCIEKVCDEVLEMYQQRQAKDGYDSQQNEGGGASTTPSNIRGGKDNKQSTMNKESEKVTQLDPPDLLNWSEYDEQYFEDLEKYQQDNPVKLHFKYRDKMERENSELLNRKTGKTLQKTGSDIKGISGKLK